MQPQWLTMVVLAQMTGMVLSARHLRHPLFARTATDRTSMPRRPRSLGRDQTSAGRNYPTIAPPNYRIDFSKSRHGVAPGSLPDAIRSLQHSRTISNLTHYPTIDGVRLRFGKGIGNGFGWR